MPCFKVDEHQYISLHQELHEKMLEAWGPIFNKYRDRNPPSFLDFINAFPNCLPENFAYSEANPVSIPAITCERVQAVTHQLKTSSPGADFWTVAELKFLQNTTIQNLTRIYQLIESIGFWPTTLREIPVACLRKAIGCPPLDIRPIALTKSRIWARLRWADLKDWYLSWVPDLLKGGIPGREPTDAYFQVMMEAEYSNASNHQFLGCLFEMLR